MQFMGQARSSHSTAASSLPLLWWACQSAGNASGLLLCFFVVFPLSVVTRLARFKKSTWTMTFDTRMGSKSSNELADVSWTMTSVDGRCTRVYQRSTWMTFDKFTRMGGTSSNEQLAEDARMSGSRVWAAFSLLYHT